MKRTFTHTDAKPYKFWSIELSADGKSYTFTYGNVGANGQSITEDFPSTNACREAADTLIANRMSRGYLEQKPILPAMVIPRSTDAPLKLIPFRVGEKFGYCTPDKTLVIPVQFDECRQFSEGLASVKIGDRYGAINPAGELVIHFKYDDLGIFTGGYAVFVRDGRSGVIDKTGDVIIPARYDKILAEFKESHVVAVERNQKWGFANTFGEELVPCIYDEVRNFHCGRAAVMKKCDRDYWGFIDMSGAALIGPTYYTHVDDFSEGTAAVTNGTEWDFIECYGGICVPGTYSNATRFVNGLAAVTVKDGSWGYIDRGGDWVIPPAFGRAKPFSQDGLAAVASSEAPHLYGYIDTTGKLVIPFKYTRAFEFSEGLAFVSTSGNPEPARQGTLFDAIVIDKQGNELATLQSCSCATPYQNGTALVQVDGKKWGTLNREGKPVVEIRFDAISEFVDGVAEVVSAKEFSKRAFVGNDGTEYWQKDNAPRQP